MEGIAQKLIPGKTQLLSKRPEMFAPGIWPAYYSKARGSAIWDLDGNKYLDFSIAGIGANILGYADPDVDKAVIKSIKNGSSSSLNCPEEVELAEYLALNFNWLKMFRYTRSGGEAIAVAIRLARAYTKKEIILFCGYHGWHDWYLSANIENPENLNQHLLGGLSTEGVPKSLTGTSMPFLYNDINSLTRLLEKHDGNVAAVIMEPKRDVSPLPNFLADVKTLCDKFSAVLIFDEITSAFRENPGPLHAKYKIYPDISIFSKAISNGYPMGIIAGVEKIMQIAQESFISSTTWTERIGPVAASATVKKYIKFNVHEHLGVIGDLVYNGWNEMAKSAGLEIKVQGLRSLLNFKFMHADDLILRTLFVQMMLQKGFLASNKFYAMYAHTEKSIQNYLLEVGKVFEQISFYLRTNTHQEKLVGPVAHAGFQRLT